MSVIAVIVAAGSGQRAADPDNPMPKQYRHLDGRSVLAKTIDAFTGHEEVSRVITVISSEHEALYHQSVKNDSKLLPPVNGGDSRMASVKCGLDAIADHRPDIVLVHDAARPFVSARIISETIATARTHGGAVPTLPVRDTVQQVTEAGAVSATLDRDLLRLAQTPQTFRYEPLVEAHNRAEARNLTFTDDAAVFAWAGETVMAIEGDPANRKLTTLADFIELGDDLGSKMTMTTRIGSGFDVHAFEAGTEIVLGGVTIPHDRKLKGHSDADVVLHVVTDALLGALAEGDIGDHFPPSDAAWKDADSEVFIVFARDRVTARHGRIENIDVTVICEEPKIKPHRAAIRTRIAEICGIIEARVSVKATTTEGLGFAGRREGIAAQAVVSVSLPDEDLEQ